MLTRTISTPRGREAIARRIVWGRRPKLLPRDTIERTLVSFLELLHTRIQEAHHVSRNPDNRADEYGGEGGA